MGSKDPIHSTVLSFPALQRSSSASSPLLPCCCCPSSADLNTSRHPSLPTQPSLLPNLLLAFHFTSSFLFSSIRPCNHTSASLRQSQLSLTLFPFQSPAGLFPTRPYPTNIFLLPPPSHNSTNLCQSQLHPGMVLLSLLS